MYWCETAVIEFYSILKLPFATRWHAFFSVPFFIVHFGFFLGVTGFMAIAFYVILDEPVGRQWEAVSPIAVQFALLEGVTTTSYLERVRRVGGDSRRVTRFLLAPST